MLPLITNEQISDYQKDGVVLVRNLFDAEWLQVLAEGIEENLRNRVNAPPTM